MDRPTSLPLNVPGYGAIDHAGPYGIYDIGERHQHRRRPQRRHHFRLSDGRRSDPPPGQVTEAAERLCAKNYLCRIRVDGKQLDAEFRPKHLLQVRRYNPTVFRNALYVRIEGRQIDRIEFRLVP